ncbi:hypothetical protein C8Q80DRAFT_1124130 [Daedaleopsis nitida]|nr:hypothetical protein C8Q80DRAFT_1124130 [Daedaleopsis nitida]
MAPKAKRQAPAAAGGSKKKQLVSFKMHEIPGLPRPSSSTPSQPATGTTVDTRSYQAYELSDGRLCSRHEDRQIHLERVPLQPASSSTLGDTVTVFLQDQPAVSNPEVDAIINEYPVHEDPLHPIEEPIKLKKKRPQPELRAAAKIQEWLPMRQEFLDELLRYHGGEYAVDTSEDICCATCKGHAVTPLRCMDCTTRTIHCPSCVLSTHNHLPLHLLEMWNGKMWTKRSLQDLGLILQLGHDGRRYPRPAQGTRRLVIGDVTGIHQVEVRFCECLNSEDDFTHQWVQVFRLGWFPATTHRPATAFTFRMLSAFHELNLQAKLNLYDYWCSLQRLTDNTGTGTHLATHVMRLWRHLTTLKRGTRGHDPTGARGTQEGNLALECPACPQPGKNIPDDWESAPPEIKWIYTLFLMLDANFRAKLKDCGLQDIELGPGWSYYVENAKFKSHVQSIGSQLDNANLRRQGYIASGVGAVLCARHAMVRKNAVGDLPNGEKFLIMDYLLFSTVLGITLLLLISYDIACQWHKKLARRALEDLPAHIATDIAGCAIRYAIPKKHIRVHGPNRSQFSFNFIRWVGRTYGEGTEAHWAHMNPVALSAREMAPGMCREHMDDHWLGWNWQKIIGFATQVTAKQQAAHENLSATFKPEDVMRWDSEVRAWHEHPTETNDPFEEHQPNATLKLMRLQIADEEANELAAGTLPPHDVSPGVFLQVGLELEEQQRSLSHRQKKMSGTDTSLTEVQEKRTVLQRRIETWQDLQNLHMLIVTQFHRSGNADGLAAGATTTTPNSDKAEDIRLWLPSALPEELRSSLAPGLLDKEQRLRIAQADNALDNIRQLRRILTGISDFRRLNVSGTGQRTAGKDLSDGDLRGPGREEDERPSEGRFEISWIWLVPRAASGPMTPPDGVQGDLDPDEFLANVKVEWARSQARAHRWGKEVVLLEEEMRRIIEYFEWKAAWWRERKRLRTDTPNAVQRGLSSYGEYQSSIYEDLAWQCARAWVPYLRTRARPLPVWTSTFDIPETVSVSGELVLADAATPQVALPGDTCAGVSVSTALPDDTFLASSTDTESNYGTD